MRILFACEQSGYPSEFFCAPNLDVFSVDLQPGDNITGRTHFVADLFEHLNSSLAYDALICFPPCTFLSRASTPHINSPGRRQSALAAIEFVRKIFLLPIPNIAIENPIGFLNTNWQRPSQVIYPWQFGDQYSKDICLWLRGFPPLVPTHNSHGQLRSMQNHTNGRMSQDLKSRVKSSWGYFPGLCAAMSSQWSSYLRCPPVVNSLFTPINYF